MGCVSVERPSWLGRRAAGVPDDSPRPGQVFKVHTDILGRRDAHPDAYRPAVVVSVNREVAKVFVITRTTRDVEGVDHPARPAVGLDKAGVFDGDWYQGVDTAMFVPPFVEYLYDLAADEPAVWGEVVRLWEQS